MKGVDEVEAIVSLDLIKRIAHEERGLVLSDRGAGEILYRMEEELKSILSDLSSSAYTPLAKKGDYRQWILEDNVYPESVAKYIKGYIPDDDIEELPGIISGLLVKYIERW
jgi:hypothetical protein